MTAPPSPVVLLWGEDPYLVRAAALELLGGFDVTEVDGDVWQGTELQNLATPALFGEPRALLVTDARALPKEATGELAGYLAATQGDAALVVCCTVAERGKPPAPESRLGGKAERFARYDLERNWKILDAVRAVARETGKSPSAVSIAWLLARPQVTSVIFGARTVEQLDTNLAGAELELAPGQLAALDQASAFDLGYPYAFIQSIQSSW